MARRRTATRTADGRRRAPRAGSKRAPAASRQGKARTGGPAKGPRTAKQGRSRAASRPKTAASAGRGAAKKAAARRPAAGKSAANRATGRVKLSPARKPRTAPRPPREVTADIERRWDIEEEGVPTPPSTLDLDRRASAARTGRAEMAERRRKHTAASPTITGGDVDADWEGAYFVGDESATGDNPTPDQSEVEDVGRAVGVEYDDAEELKSTPKIDRRDKKRWELDPASSEDYKDRTRRGR